MAKIDDPTLDPYQSYESAMRNLIARRWAAVWAAVPAAVAGEDIEGVHDVRVASRRLRAAMDVAVACFPAGWYAPLHRVAKEITGSLGEVRDRDVMIESLAKARKKAPAKERPGIDHLIARLERERDTARAEMVRYLDDLMSGDVPREVEARFGPETAPATSTKDAA